MKLIDEKEVEEAARIYADEVWGKNYITECKNYHTDGFKQGTSFAEQKLQPMMVELIDYIDENEWNNNVTSREKLEQFLKTRQK